MSRSELIFISVAARLLDMHPQTLRKYERLGLVRPARTLGSMRLYSAEEIELLRFIKRLVEDEVHGGDRKGVASGKSVYYRVDLGGRRSIQTHRRSSTIGCRRHR